MTFEQEREHEYRKLVARLRTPRSRRWLNLLGRGLLVLVAVFGR